MRRFDIAALLGALLFGAVSGLYLTAGLRGGDLPIPTAWVLAGLLIGLGLVGIARAVFRRRDH